MSAEERIKILEKNMKDNIRLQNNLFHLIMDMATLIEVHDQLIKDLSDEVETLNEITLKAN